MPTLEQQNLNLRIYHNYLDRLQNIAFTMFEWEGLPESINARYLEQTLHRYGMVLFFNSPEMGYLALRCVGHDLNVYEEFTRYRVSTLTGHTWEHTTDEAVVIFNNPQRFSTVETLELYAQKLYDCDTTIRTNLKAMKTPILITGTKQQQTTLRKLYEEYEGNTPVIFGDKQLDMSGLEVMKTDAPYIADRITELKHDIWNEVLTFLGIKSSNTDKKERMVTDEAKANAEFSDHNILVMLKEREEAAERINKMFGLNVSVKLRDLPEKLKGDESEWGEPETQEGGNDE